LSPTGHRGLFEIFFDGQQVYSMRRKKNYPDPNSVVTAIQTAKSIKLQQPGGSAKMPMIEETETPEDSCSCINCCYVS